MPCPPEIARIIGLILQHGLLQIRVAGWEGNADNAAKLADHVHNLPDLLTEFSPEKLNYYWEVERPAFLESVDESLSAPYADFWDQLEDHAVDSRHKTRASIPQD